MYRYGQYCPVAKAAEILGDRWTLLIVRDLLTGTCHFNDLERGLPGISRGLLADRLRRLQRMGLVKKLKRENGRQRTEYRLTQAGQELESVIQVLLTWGAQWAFGDPEPDDLDPILLLWWMRGRVRVDQLPEHRVVVQFDFKGATTERYWLILTKEDVSVCLTYPGFDIDVLVTADLATFFQIWLGRIDFAAALRQRRVEIDAIPGLARAFPRWFAYSIAADAVRAVTAAGSSEN
jgi:DNA-binding HxlR family transcriptional regulator